MAVPTKGSVPRDVAPQPKEGTVGQLCQDLVRTEVGSP